MKRFGGQVAIVTGGGQGIGKAISQRLLAEGARVAIVDVSRTHLEAAEKDLRGQGASEILGLQADVTKAADVSSAVERVIQKWNKIDVLVQAAGITGKTGVQTQNVDFDDWNRVFQVNVNGIFLFTKYVLPHMAEKKYGRIVNIASISGKEGNAGMAAYSASKAAVIGFTKVVGKEYAEQGITCNAIAPAVIRTAMVDAMPETQVKYMTDKIPMKRTGTLEEIAALAAYAASPESSFITAFTFDLSGGRATY